MGKKKAVKLGINLGQYPNEGGRGCPSPNQKFTKNDIKDHIKITNHQKKWTFS